MISLNNNFLKLQDNYLFSSIAQKVSAYKKIYPDKKIINMGIGDVYLPLPEVCISAIKKATDEMASSETFKGYGPEQGYEFLREKISSYDYKNLNISPNEIFISDGAKCDLERILSLFDSNNIVAIPDPVYPVYVDTNVIGGRSGNFDSSSNIFKDFTYLLMNEANNFIPSLPKNNVDLIYLCSPNNPTGTVLDKSTLQKWVNYAIENNCIILYDSAYEAFITDPNIPHSIYEIDNSKQVAIEFRSFSKTAGFTGLRCGYLVIPDELLINSIQLNKFYKRFLSCSYNGTSYVVQKAAEALYAEDGLSQIKHNINYYLNNAKIITNKLSSLSIKCYGGINSPYIWLKIPNNMKSWDFFDVLLTKANVVGTPGIGFGPSGDKFFRLTAFNSLGNTVESMNRLEKILI